MPAQEERTQTQRQHRGDEAEQEEALDHGTRDEGAQTRDQQKQKGPVHRPPPWRPRTVAHDVPPRAPSVLKTTASVPRCLSGAATQHPGTKRQELVAIPVTCPASVIPRSHRLGTPAVSLSTR